MPKLRVSDRAGKFGETGRGCGSGKRRIWQVESYQKEICGVWDLAFRIGRIHSGAMSGLQHNEIGGTCTRPELAECQSSLPPRPVGGAQEVRDTRDPTDARDRIKTGHFC